MDKNNKNLNISEHLRAIHDIHNEHYFKILKYFVKNIQIDYLEDYQIFLKKNSINNCNSRYVLHSLLQNDFLSKSLKEKLLDLDILHKEYHKITAAFLKKILSSNKNLSEESFDKFNNTKNLFETCILESIIEAESFEKKYDGLTGFFNKKYFFEEVQKHINNKNTYFIMSDIDYFKKVNDTYGHDAGDFILKELSTIYKNQLREEDILGRFGGEEFIFMINSSKDNIKKIFERLRKTIESKKFLYNGIEIKITTSFGIAKKESFIDINSLVKMADSALYSAKNNGRNQIIFFK